MIVKPYELNKIKSDLKFFLFYGKNEGLKNQHIKQLLDKNNKSNNIKYDFYQKFEFYNFKWNRKELNTHIFQPEVIAVTSPVTGQVCISNSEEDSSRWVNNQAFE